MNVEAFSREMEIPQLFERSCALHTMRTVVPVASRFSLDSGEFTAQHGDGATGELHSIPNEAHVDDASPS
jgi:hypothetical protein